MNTNKVLSYLNKRLIIASTLVVIVLFVILHPFNSWFFGADDAGYLWHSKIRSLQDFLYLFIKGKDGTALYFPSNFNLNDSNNNALCSGIHAFYRPLTLVFFGIQELFFGNNPYPYFVVMAVFHALNTGLLFYIFYHVHTSYLAASLGALFFGLHHSYWGWMGWLSTQPYTTSLFLLLVATIAFHQSLTSSNENKWRIVAGITYTLAVFLFEFTFVFPIFILLAWVMYYKRELKTFFYHSYELWIGAFFFLIIRLFICMNRVFIPFQNKSLQMVIPRIKADLLSFIADLGNIARIPSGHFILKSSILLFLGLIISYLYMQSKKKKLLLCCLISMTLFLWPVFLNFYCLRYLYYALPFYALFFIVLFSDQSQKVRYAAGIISIGIISYNSILIIKGLKDYYAYLKIKTNAINQLLSDPRIANRHVCFIGIPRAPFTTGLAQHFWFCGHSESHKIFYDPSTFVFEFESINNTDVTIELRHKTCYLTSHNHQTVWWVNNEPIPCGEKKILEEKDGIVYALSYDCTNLINTYHPLFVSWDYEKKTFFIISTSY